MTTAPAAYMSYAARMGARKRILARMGLNSAVDVTLGSVPLAGDFFDVYFKPHKRNAAVLRAEALRQLVRRAARRANVRRGFAGSGGSLPAR